MTSRHRAWPLALLLVAGWGIGTDSGRTALAGMVTGFPAGAASAGSNRTADKLAPRAVAAARRQLGEPYLWGADGPGAWDCSGLVIHGAWDAVGADWPDTTADGLGHHFPATGSPGPGDLALWDWDGDGTWDHVALVSRVAAGRVTLIEAPRRGVPVREVALAATGHGAPAYRRPSGRW